MKRWLIALALLCAVVPASAFWQSRDSNYNKNVVASGGGFTGTGDVQSGFKMWWSPGIGYNAAYAAPGTNKAANVCDSSGGGCIDLLVGTNGYVAAPGATACGGAPCTLIKTLYDQSGGLNCGGSPCDLTQATAANMPNLVTTCGGGANRICAGIVNVPSPRSLNNTSVTAISQPWNISAVVYVSSLTGGITLVGAGGCTSMLKLGGAVMTLQATGSSFSSSGNYPFDQVFGTSGVANGASSIVAIYSGGSSAQTTGNPGNGNWPGSNSTFWGFDGGCESVSALTGFIHEAGVKDTPAWSGATVTAIQAQQATNWAIP